ncbi:peptidyl-tRNA hydrolase [Thozetella sp. PMI_491]|nr:peptidyl-tRNA hydrolase [Thozetella sp. PMI_491]
MSLSRLLVISLGNPAPYASTFHSAGHIALAALQQLQPAEHPPFERRKYGKEKARSSDGPKYTLLQSPTLMNVSGPWVHKIWKRFAEEHDPTRLGLVVLHDDLEERLGVVKIRDWERSGRGHNGIKSMKAHMAPLPGYKWARVSIGVGRPGERDRDSVSDFVLRDMPQDALSTIERSASEIYAALQQLETKWNAQIASAARRDAADKTA